MYHVNVNVNLADQMWNNDKCRCKCENPKQPNACKKTMFGILLLVVGKMLNI